MHSGWIADIYFTWIRHKHCENMQAGAAVAVQKCNIDCGLTM